MSRTKCVKDVISLLEFELVKQKAVLAAFPDANVTSGYYHDFTSKTVNQVYTDYTFIRQYNGLFVLPYCEVEFTHNDILGSVKVYSHPKKNRLVYLSRRKVNNKSVMKFARMAINFKNNSIRKDILNSCQLEIMSFIQDKPGYHLDTKNLDSRLKKLLIFA